jgi:adenylate cyclase
VAPIPILSNAARQIGFAVISQEENAVIRSYPFVSRYNDKYYGNLGLIIALDALGADSVQFAGKRMNILSKGETIRSVPLNTNGRYTLAYYGPRKTFRYCSFSDVYMHRIPADFFQDKIVLVGSSAYGLNDLKSTPVGVLFPGVELHATAIENLLHNDYVYYPNPWVLYAGFFAFLLLLSLWLRRLNPLWGIAVTVGWNILFVGLALGAYVLLRFEVPFVTPVVSLYFLYAGHVIYRYQTQEREKRQIKAAFERYVAPTVVKVMLEHPEKLRFGGQVSDVAVLYTDIQGFTKMTEENSPAEVTAFLRHFLTLATSCIYENRGMLDKYVGDAVVAMFNVPVPMEGYVERTVRTALQIREIEHQVREHYAGHKDFGRFHNRIGIASGPLVVGNLGSEQLFDYTGIGDVMNLAARIENLNRYYGTDILISEATRRRLPPDILCRRIDCVCVRGRSMCETIYQVLGDAEHSCGEFTESLVMQYESALDDYQAGRWDEAGKGFDQVLAVIPTDGPANVMRMRINELRGHTDWDGVWKNWDESELLPVE